ncbi:hypothetical protein KSD_17420 [Ktedonobacter sp. SOSP1-85]|uniref:hypothetical protein n=1 Tax=Ktedonobacter sp. SOSP1-85 TaxID=2778367 RepID=UPI0019168B27|nr:hypothetical protein [Ktedonobacter sp. SOSP1-85]GHO73971.1 hypothetical protein KSD_17420 [Ktedonobacter sp. SOSP1-85]
MTEQHMRPDAGVRYTEEERRCLRWTAEQGGAQFEQVQRLLARLSPNPEKLANPMMLSVQRTRKKKDRWKDGGLIAYKIFEANKKGWLWLTRQGLEFVGLGDLRYYEPKLESLRHLYYVNQARLYIEQQRPEDVWKSERLIRYEQPAFSAGKKVPHVPDALLQKPNGETIAIEVELTLKKRERILAILKESTHTYHRTWYFVARPAWTTVEAALAQLPEHQRKRVQILSVEEKLQ